MNRTKVIFNLLGLPSVIHSVYYVKFNNSKTNPMNKYFDLDTYKKCQKYPLVNSKEGVVVILKYEVCIIMGYSLNRIKNPSM